MQFDATKLSANVYAASTEDLLHRTTAYRVGMEPTAVRLIEAELRRRGVTDDDVAAFEMADPDILLDDAGCALTCSFCPRPAVTRGWGWHWLWGAIPLVPRTRGPGGVGRDATRPALIRRRP